MPNIYNETMNVPSDRFVDKLEKYSFPVGMLMNVKIKGCVVKSGGKALVEITKASSPDSKLDE